MDFHPTTVDGVLGAAFTERRKPSIDFRRRASERLTDVGIYRGSLHLSVRHTFQTQRAAIMTIPVLQEALNDAISSGRFIDTKVVLFSRRDSSGRVCKPGALYASSHVLKSVPYFKTREFSLCPFTSRTIILPLSTLRRIC